MDLPVKVSNPSDQKAHQYRIKTKDLSYKLPPRYDKHDFICRQEVNNSTKKYILKKVSCEAKPGEITAIAGPSGAGKTTLLDVLAGMIVSCRISGRVFVNDQPMDVTYFRRVSGYVTQNEELFPLLTVEETLLYSARLRLREGGRQRAAARVTELLKELGLDHVAGTRIGGECRRGISGGEKRRVSIGIDLVHNPAVLLIDEPTSGLDSASALQVVLLLKSMAKDQGKTIILTIHQPAFRILRLIDQVVLLSNGSVLHNGSLHLLEERLKFAGYSIPQHVNVLEFAIDVTETFHVYVEENDMEKIETEEEQVRKPSSLSHDEEHHISYSNSQFMEVIILSQRFSTNIFRTKQLFATNTIQAVLAGILLGTIFMNLNDDSKKYKLQNQIGFFAFSLTFLLSSTLESLPIFFQERTILMRETSRGAYRISSYVIANTLVFLPFLLTVALLYTSPVYWLVGLRKDTAAFLYFSLVAWMILLMSNSLVSCFSALAPNFIVAMTLIAGVLGSCFLFSGYFIMKEDIPKYWIFMHYLSLFKYPLECFIINEFGGEAGKSRCLEKMGDECILYGNQFLVRQGLNESQRWTNLILMLIFIVGYRFLSFLILLYRSHRSRI